MSSYEESRFKGLTVEDQFFMAKLLGLGENPNPGVFIEIMRRMLSGSIELEDGREMNYDLLASEMVKHGIGLGFVDDGFKKLGDDLLTVNLANNLHKAFLSDQVHEEIYRKQEK